MRSLSIIKTEAPGTAAPLAAANAQGDVALRRDWGFASDAQAALLVCLYAADMLVIAGAGIASYTLRMGSPSLTSPYETHIAVGCLLFVLIMQITGMYNFRALRSRWHLARLSVVWTEVVVILIVLIYLSKLADEYSRAWMVSWAVLGWLGLIGIRVLTERTMRWLRVSTRLVTQVAVVGCGVAAEHCARSLQAAGNEDVEVVGVFEAGQSSKAGQSSRKAGQSSRDVPITYTRRLQRLAADRWIDEVIIAASCSDMTELGPALSELGSLAVDVKLFLDFAGARGAGHVPSILVPVWERPLAGLPTLFKRWVDVSLSAFLLFLLSPLIGVIAAAIKLESSGPVLFKQRRFGFSKKPFTLYKFRSMRHEAGNNTSTTQARPKDPRLTRFGGFLRRSSLDELPQLINVLKGEMSLVGPRPHPTTLDDKYANLIDGYLARHRVKPGMTGWAQVNGFRGETDTLKKMEHRLQYDLFYINNWSPLLDLRILCQTLVAVAVARNAY